MSINKIEIQDDNGNVYYPKTSIDSVIYSDKTSIEEKIRILEYRLNELKGQLADSINNKTGSSLTSNSTVDEMTVVINSIKTLEQATADANATASNILIDKTAYVNGMKITGTMPNKGTSTNTLTLNGSLTLPKGYYDSIKVTQSVTTRGSTTDAISQGHSGDYVYTRIPQGAYFTNASTGYPEIKSKFSDIANAVGLTPNKLVSGNTIGGIAGTATAKSLLKSGYISSLDAYYDDGNETHFKKYRLEKSLFEFVPTYIWGNFYYSAYSTILQCFFIDLSHGISILFYDDEQEGSEAERAYQHITGISFNSNNLEILHTYRNRYTTPGGSGPIENVYYYYV